MAYNERLTIDGIEKRISEMWMAVNDIPADDPGRDGAVRDAQRVEQDLHDRFNNQERMYKCAPVMLEALYYAKTIGRNGDAHDVIARKCVDDAIAMAVGDGPPPGSHFATLVSLAHQVLISLGETESQPVIELRKFLNEYL